MWQMEHEGIKLDVVSLTSLIQYCCIVGKITDCIRLVESMVINGPRPNTLTVNTLLIGLCKNQLLGLAETFFNYFKQIGVSADTTTYNVLIRAFIHEGNDLMVGELSREMSSHKLRQDLGTYGCFVNDLCRRGERWDAQVLGEAPHKFKSAVEAVKKLREIPDIGDQLLMVMLLVRYPKIHYAGMLQFDGELPNKYLVSPPEMDRTSGEYLVHNGIRTFACSETLKFGHVTFFWNGNCSGYLNEKMEEYVEIGSDSGNLTMSSSLPFPAPHKRKNVDATIVACKAADQAVKMILDAIEQVGGIYVVTADHGNAEDMVPVAIDHPGLAPGVRFHANVPTGRLANVAATVMNLHGFKAPSDYETTLIEVVS
ncbi:hypothetical protein SASPL_136146 [Salvia splendens]|uniref:Metalloenzyme domain-containing protein n=1 Tax=Salvia splendens TaxID=180675 RepID=A0A8X8X015_SALSN|nr:hypothetical protein SASPL_136146 [Salvia splendens]